MTIPGTGWYHVDKDGKQQGPIDQFALIALLSNGQIDAATLIWAAGYDNWKSFGSVFNDLVSPPIPLAPPPPIPASKSPAETLSQPSTSGRFPTAHTRYYKRPDESTYAIPTPGTPEVPAEKSTIFELRDSESIHDEAEVGRFEHSYSRIAHIVSLILGGTLLVLVERANAQSLAGMIGFLAMGAKFASIAILVGLLGLLNKAARLQAFVLISWVAIIVIALLYTYTAASR